MMKTFLLSIAFISAVAQAQVRSEVVRELQGSKWSAKIFDFSESVEGVAFFDNEHKIAQWPDKTQEGIIKDAPKGFDEKVLHKILRWSIEKIKEKEFLVAIYGVGTSSEALAIFNPLAKNKSLVYWNAGQEHQSFEYKANENSIEISIVGPSDRVPNGTMKKLKFVP